MFAARAGAAITASAVSAATVNPRILPIPRLRFAVIGANVRAITATRKTRVETGFIATLNTEIRSRRSVLLNMTFQVSEIIDICPPSELPPGGMRLVEWEDLEIGVFNCAGT